MIEISNLTKHYKSGKGIFNLTFSVKEGEVFGYLGPNGAGKTTTIRHLLGFLRADNGKCVINGLDCRRESALIQRVLGYLPEESVFLEDMTGEQFLNFMSDMRGINDYSRQSALIERFDLDAAVRIRKMSKGMRQKLGLITAFMHDPAVYVLDEPTGGLDPLMQNIFIDLILEERGRGKTVLMSSHRFEEIERSCDKAGIIRKGLLVAVEDVHSLKSSQRRAYIVTVASESDITRLRSAGLEIGKVNQNRVEVFVTGNYNAFVQALTECEVLGIDVVSQNLEQLFMKYYDIEGQES